MLNWIFVIVEENNRKPFVEKEMEFVAEKLPFKTHPHRLVDARRVIEDLRKEFARIQK